MWVAEVWSTNNRRTCEPANELAGTEIAAMMIKMCIETCQVTLGKGPVTRRHVQVAFISWSHVHQSWSRC